MGQQEGTFQRYEKKYLVDENKYKKLCKCLEDRFEVDEYGESTICNIYFDTTNHLLIRNSIEQPVYKEKLRLRSYGTPEEGDPAYVELKKKYKGIVYKRRVKMELTDAEQYLYYHKPVVQSSQITREIDWFLQFYKEIEPAMYISYQRTALYGLEQRSLRITFDRNIMWRDTKLWLEYGSFGYPLLKDGERLMEIKIPNAMPLWLAQTLNDLEIYPVSFSKYGRGYLASLTMKDQEIEQEIEQEINQEINQERIKGEKLYA